MSTYADDVRISNEPGPAPASESADVTTGDTSAEDDHSDCPYCGDTGREQVRRYRFCGHDAP
jgi:hypothetical protein